MLEMIISFLFGVILSATFFWLRYYGSADGTMHLKLGEDGSVTPQSLYLQLTPEELGKRRMFMIEITASHEKQGAI